MADGVMYWEDVTETLAAFIEAFPPGGALLMQSKGAMAVQLASVHDSLLPQVHASMSGASPAETLKVRLLFPLHHWRSHGLQQSISYQWACLRMR